MWGGSLTAELRHSVRLLATERRLFAGFLLACPAYGLWVVLTGRLVQVVVPSLGTATADSLSLVAALLWVAVPAFVAMALLDRYLMNTRGNLESRYRFDHPSLLLAPSGLPVLALVGLTAAAGPSLPLLLLTAVAATHLFVRTVAYGHRVYSLSVPALLSVLSFLAAAGLAVAWLVHVPEFGSASETLGAQLSAAGVGAVAETVVAASGADATTVRAVTALLPAVLSAAYVVPQSVAGLAVSLRAPLEDPRPRPGQRYPGTGRGAAGESAAAPSRAATNGSADATGDPSDGSVGSTTDNESEDTEAEPAAAAEERPGTRVFTPDQPIPEPEAAQTEETTGDEWFDDTAVFTEHAASERTPDRCPACQTDIPLETTVSFCPNCGERLD